MPIYDGDTVDKVEARVRKDVGVTGMLAGQIGDSLFIYVRKHIALTVLRLGVI